MIWVYVRFLLDKFGANGLGKPPKKSPKGFRYIRRRQLLYIS